jgi:hypothetical protein
MNDELGKSDKKLFVITFILMLLACIFSGLTLWLVFL